MTNAWKYPGCRGAFYSRDGVIYYRAPGNRRRTLKLEDNRRNRRIAGEMVLAEENSAIFASDQPQTISAAFETFLEKSLRSKSHGTIKKYVWALRIFEQDYSLTDTNKINNAIYRFINNPANKLYPDRPLTDRTVNSALRHISAFFNYCLRQGWITKVPFDREMYLKTPDKVIEVFEPDELRRIFEYWREKDYEFYNLLKIIYLTAFRIKEAVSLRRSQFMSGKEFRDVILLPSSKYGDKPDEFPLSDVVIEEIKRNPNFRNGRQKLFRWHTYGFLNKLFTQSLHELGIAKQTTDFYEPTATGRCFHTLRKTRITEWISAGYDFLTIVKLSRDSISTVKKYYARMKTSDYKIYVK